MNVKLKKKLLLLFSILNSKKTFCGPLNVNINILSGQCNSRCAMCAHYSSLGRIAESKIKYFPLEYLRKLLAELEEMEVENITFCADGEPFLYPDILPLLGHLKKTRINYQFITNGLLINESHLQLMDKKASIRLSLHASNENLWSDITGLPPAGFRELIRKVKLLRNTGAKIIIHSVINKKNFADLPQLILLAHECKADEVSIGPVTIFNDHLNVLKLAKDEFERFKMSLLDAESMADKYRVDNNIKYYLNLEYSEKKSFSIGKTNSKLACYAGWLFAWINIDGDLRFCCNSNKLMGNITEKSFRNIWYGAEYNQERHNAFLRKNGSADCQECANYMANIKVGGIMSIYNRVFGRK